MTSSRRGGKDATNASGDGPRIIKKYPNRRLYDTRTSSYITLADVKAMVLGLEVYEIRDAKTGEDLTRSILLQIILEEETVGMPMFSTQMLAQIIRFYGHTMQGLMGVYLEKNLQSFVDVQRRMSDPAAAFDPKAFQPEGWAPLVGLPNPAVQGMMTGYLEQTRQLFSQMQDQMQKQTSSLFARPPASDGDSGER